MITIKEQSALTAPVYVTADNFEAYRADEAFRLDKIETTITSIRDELNENQKQDILIMIRIETLRKWLLRLIILNCIMVICIIILFFI